MVVIEKMHSCEKWRFYCVKRPKVFLWKQNIHENQFVYKSISLQNLMRCKTFFRNVTCSKIFDSKNPELWKISSKSDALELLDCKYDALYKKGFKNWFFSKKLIQNSFSLKTTFFGKLFQECTKNQLWRFKGVHWLAKRFFESAFYKRFWFSKNSCSLKSDALEKSWFKFWRYVEIQFKNRQDLKSLIQNLTRCKNTDSKNDELCEID